MISTLDFARSVERGNLYAEAECFFEPREHWDRETLALFPARKRLVFSIEKEQLRLERETQGVAYRLGCNKTIVIIEPKHRADLPSVRHFRPVGVSCVLGAH